jgi:excisionase family DNA binding protein
MFKLNGDYATVSEAVEILGVNQAYVRRVLQQGRVSGAVKIGRDWLIPVINGQIQINKKAKQMSVTELKEQIFEVGGLEVDWSDESEALAQVEADAQAIVADLVEQGVLSSVEGENLVSNLMESYV